MSKILFIDIETFPLESWTWGIWDQNVIEIKKQSIICCFSTKWAHSDTILTQGLPDYKKQSEKLLVSDLWNILDSADLVVAHNGDQFDIKRMNARFIHYGMKPPTPYKTVDTKKVAKRIFGFPSNRLDDLCQYLGIGEKMNTGGFDLWKGCMKGDPESWAKMKTYNEHDVVLLEQLYFRLLPWISNHPNISESPVGCPKCGSTRLQSRGVARNATTVYKRYQCQRCGGWGRDTKSESKQVITNV